MVTYPYTYTHSHTQNNTPSSNRSKTGATRRKTGEQQHGTTTTTTTSGGAISPPTKFYFLVNLGSQSNFFSLPNFTFPSETHRVETGSQIRRVTTTKWDDTHGWNGEGDLGEGTFGHVLVNSAMTGGAHTADRDTGCCAGWVVSRWGGMDIGV